MKSSSPMLAAGGGSTVRGDNDTGGWVGGCPREGVVDVGADEKEEAVGFPSHRSPGCSRTAHSGDDTGTATTCTVSGGAIQEMESKGPNASPLPAFGGGGADKPILEPATGRDAASCQGFGRPNTVLHEARTSP